MNRISVSALLTLFTVLVPSITVPHASIARRESGPPSKEQTANNPTQKTPAAGDWGCVQCLTAGEKVELRMKSGRKLDGTVLAASDTTLTLTRRDKTEDFSNKDIQRIYRMEGRSYARTIYLGAGVGAGIGAGIGLTLYLPHSDDIVGWIVPVLALIGAGIGALAGAIAGAINGGRKRVLVYESR
jgi:hypothetical protein